MRRRTSNTEVGSLELLLDTICNMFGGIVLMAILVVIQTQTSAHNIRRTSVDADMALDIRSLRAESLRLENAVLDLKTQATQAEDKYRSTVPPASQDLLDRLEQFAAAGRDGLQRLEAARQKQSLLENQLARSDMDLRSTVEQASARERELSRLKNQLLALSVELPQSVRLPHRRGKVEGIAMYYLVSGGRAYRVGPIRWEGDAYVTGDCTAEPWTNPLAPLIPALKLRPREGAGLEIREKPARGDALLASLAEGSPQTHYIVMFVYDNNASYAHFQIMKKIVLERGYQHVVGPKIELGEDFIVGPVQYHESD